VWFSVLKISTFWRCLSLRKLAIREIESESATALRISPILRLSNLAHQIVLGRTYFITRWVVAGYTLFVKKGGITDGQMQMIGTLESFKLMRIISENHKRPQDLSSLKKTIKETFAEELQSIKAAEKTYETEGTESLDREVAKASDV
jgi:hypothetical protein